MSLDWPGQRVCVSVCDGLLPPATLGFDLIGSYGLRGFSTGLSANSW